MVICKYFLRGSCRFGESCKNEHAYNNENAGSVLRKKQDIEPSVLIKSVSNDMDKAEKGNQWPLSCYGPFQGKICFPGFEDKCFEEIRLGMYEAERNGTVEQYKQQLNLLLQEARMKMRSLQNPTPEAMNMLKELFNLNNSENNSGNVYQNTQTNSVFANSAPSNQTNSIFGNTAANPAGQSIFNQPTAANTAKNFTFALPENKTIFGNTNNPASTGSIFTQLAPKPSFQNNNIFGGAGATSGQSIFATQQPAAFPGNSVFQNNQNVFAQSPTTNPPPFGAPNQPASNSPFAQQNQGQNNSPFAQQNQGQNNSPFAQQNQGQNNSPFAQQNQPVSNSPFGQHNTVGNNSQFAQQQSQASSNFPFSQQQNQAASNSPFTSQQNQTASNSPFTSQQNQTPSNSPFTSQQNQTSNQQFTSQNQSTGSSPFAPANQSPFAQSQVPANQSPFAPQNQTPFAGQTPPQSLITNQNQTPNNTPPFGGNIFSNTQATITANQANIFQQATTTANPPTSESKSIFAQQPTPVTGASIFGNAVQPQTTSGQASVFNSNQVTPLDHTKSIFGTPQTKSAIKIERQDDATVYSKLEDLSDTDRSCYEAQSFEFGGIPEKPPTLQLCS